MNNALEEFVKGSLNCFILDVRESINKRNHITDNIRHYQRKGYRNLSIELMSILNSITNVKIEKKPMFIKYLFKIKVLITRLINKIKD